MTKIAHIKEKTKPLTPCPHGIELNGNLAYVASPCCRQCQYYEDEYFDRGVRILECSKE